MSRAHDFAPFEAAVGAQPSDAAAWCRLGFYQAVSMSGQSCMGWSLVTRVIP
jgi:hypothetical protein